MLALSTGEIYGGGVQALRLDRWRSPHRMAGDAELEQAACSQDSYESYDHCASDGESDHGKGQGVCVSG